MRNWRIYLIHHSHTDIGYTERQEKLCRYHADFIRQAIAILDGVHDGRVDAPGFKWQCENMWQVETFLSLADDVERERFWKYVASGEIGLSGNYLNMTELADAPVLCAMTARGILTARERGLAPRSGMTADINGYAWGYADVMAGCGVENLFCALHPHHGLFPLGRKHFPFFWEGPKGGRVLTWVGEHYHFGNELGFAPNAGSSYMIHDDIRRDSARGRLYTGNAESTRAEELETLRLRLTRFLEGLEQDGYPWDFLPMMVSGAITDNAPPSAAVARRAAEIGAALPNVTVRMSTLQEFFDVVQRECGEIPTFTGDFTDWWADGVGSTANTVKVFRDAQRKYELCRRLDPDGAQGDTRLMADGEKNLMLYAEHTWGYSSSVTEPWDSMVADLEKKKDAYAINANAQISGNLDILLARRGEVSISIGRGQRFRVVNPYDTPWKGVARLYVEFWEYVDGCPFDEQLRTVIFNATTGKRLPSQTRRIARAFETDVLVDLQPGEAMDLLLRQERDDPRTLRNYPCRGAESVADIVNNRDMMEMPWRIETPMFAVTVEQGRGIVSIVDKTRGLELVRQNEAGAFSGVYEVTPAGRLSQSEVRRRMGRNRCSLETLRETARLTGGEIVESGEISVTARLRYQLAGCGFYDVLLKVGKLVPVIEATVCLHKHSVWDPENLYVALPFTSGGADETWIEKSGCVLRPAIDQLPGTCQNFWLLQNGMVRTGPEADVAIAIKDAPLFSLGARKAGPVELCDSSNAALNADSAWSWVLNNFWETNFKADLGGFYEFRYALMVLPHGDPARAIDACRKQNAGVPGFYS